MTREEGHDLVADIADAGFPVSMHVYPMLHHMPSEDVSVTVDPSNPINAVNINKLAAIADQHNLQLHLVGGLLRFLPDAAQLTNTECDS